MCFSATASFTAAGVLSVIGYYTTKLIKRKKELLLAFIPLLFALQQLAEGATWINYGSAQSLNASSATFIFLFIAMLVWPVWIPLALYVLEPPGIRKQGIALFLAIGIIYDCIMLANYFTMSQPISIEIIGHSIHYQIPVASNNLYRWMYYTATLVPMFLSSVSYAWALGILNIIGLLVADYYFSIQFISVWCFFAAICSILLYFIMRNYEQKDQI